MRDISVHPEVSNFNVRLCQTMSDHARLTVMTVDIKVLNFYLRAEYVVSDEYVVFLVKKRDSIARAELSTLGKAAAVSAVIIAFWRYLVHLLRPGIAPVLPPFCSGRHGDAPSAAVKKCVGRVHCSDVRSQAEGHSLPRGSWGRCLTPASCATSELRCVPRGSMSPMGGCCLLGCASASSRVV